MKLLFQILFGTFLSVLITGIASTPAFAQAGVLNPNDPVIDYAGGNNPAQPPWGTMAKWVRTKRLNWNTDSYKCYFYKGVQFRLKFPKSYQHGVNDGKLYPVYVFFHGLGEAGSIYDNEYQLFHGGQLHRDAVDNGQFDGFLLYPQNINGFFGAAQYDVVKEIIENYLVPQVKADINRIIVDGLSAGGTATWDFSLRWPQLVAAALPISAADIDFASTTNTNILKYIPIWHFQGGLDKKPAPATSHAVGTALLNAGANYTYTEFPNRGHGCWYNAWGMPDYFPYMLRANKTNPVPLGRKHEFCAGEPVNVTLGVSAGFSAYEWSKNGVTIPGATSNTYTVTSFGTYACRFRRGSVWSPWSAQPVVVKLKDPTIAPPITSLTSGVIPDPNGNSNLVLREPPGYLTYSWSKVGNNTVLSTDSLLNVNTPGDYVVKVTEEFGCISEFSAPFKVISADGPNKPDAVKNILITPLSMSQLKLDWSDNPYPAYNETNFEIYKSIASGGPYTLVGTTGADITSYIVNGLTGGATYYFIIRAINNSGASALSAEVSGSTTADKEKPTAPGNLRITTSTGNSATLAWDASTDNVGVYKYDIFVNGVKSYVTDATTFTCYNLSPNSYYNFVIKARDLAENNSVPSNKVSTYIVPTGLSLKIYLGSWTQLPDFSIQPIIAQGATTTVTLSGTGIPGSLDNFGCLYEGVINIPTSGTYTFRLNSQDGSKMWLQSYNNSATPVVNNDGDFTATSTKDGTITLSAGVYPISVAYFNHTGANTLSLQWRLPGSSSFVTIPASSYRGIAPPPVVVNAPSNPVATAVSTSKINITWADNSDNELGFEIWRSLSPGSGFVNVGTVPANTTSYSDSIGLLSSTTYFYRVRAIGSEGESDLTSNAEANWKFNNDYTDASGADRVLTPTGSPNFDPSNKIEGTHALQLNGTTQYETINTAFNFLQENYTERSFAFWMRSNSNTGDRMIIDIGSSSNGLALRLNSNTLIAGIASNNSRSTLTTAYTSTGWNHIALVYKSNSVKLYVNGIEVQANNNLSFTSIFATGDLPTIGANSGTNAFNITSGLGLFNGWIDNFSVYNAALTPADVLSAMNNTYSQRFAKTLDLPAIPAVPSALLATGNSTTSIDLNWADNADNESSYEIYRSGTDNSNYILLSTLPANTVSYIDSGLFSNHVYYYKVRAVNSGGNSDYSNEDSARSQNHAPVVTVIEDQYMRRGTQLQLNVQGTDEDGGSLNFTVTGLPAFGSFTQNGNTLVINFNPANSDAGTYPGITVTATDQQNGTGSTTFQLTVNDNYNPVISTISPITVNEKQTIQQSVNATDQNGDPLNWSFIGLPSFITVTDNGNSAQLTLNPGYADNGSYSVLARVEDGNHGFDTASFTIIVNDVNPNKKIYINFTPNTAQYPSGLPWNSTNRLPVLGGNFPDLLDENGFNSGIGFKITSPWQNQNNGTNALGVNTGNNSGVYPDNVIRTAYFTNTVLQTMRFYGFDPNSKYNFTFFGSRGNVNDDRTSVYTVKGISTSLNAANNSQNTVSIQNVAPDPDDSLTVTLQAGPTSGFAYLNAMVIESIYDDGTVPAKPRNVAVQMLNGKVNLTWIDAAYNETSYEVYRASSLTGPYTLINPGGNNIDLQQYNDVNVFGGQTYYYAILARNGYGPSLLSDTVSITTPNIAPVLSGVADVKMKTQQIVDVNLTVSDPGDVVTLKAAGLPSFASLTDNGNGTGVLHIAPGNTVGIFKNITVTATDNKGASSSKQFKITVTDKDVTSTYVNFNVTPPTTLDAYWNNLNSAPIAGHVKSNLVNEDNVPTGVSLTLVDAWQGANDLGAVTGDDSGIFPDEVMKSVFYESSTNVKRMRISGLAISGKKYNLIFFASRLAGDIRNTIYTVGSQSVTLNASNNTSNTVQINGLVPDASGNIEFTCQKDAASSFAYIGALVIQEYIDNGIPLAPTNLTVVPNSKTSIQLNWNDKSAGEDGFIVYRSLSYNGTYDSIAITAPNVTTYTDAQLSGNTAYYYKVRARALSVYSDYSNIASASTYIYSVLINFNRTNNASAPWNNTRKAPEDNDVFVNLRNDLNNPTGLNMTTLENFSGDNPNGMNTGNNSGVVPDNVMRSSWWLDPGAEAKLKFSNLNRNFVYSFVFFASRNGDGDRTTVYTIGNDNVALNASFNTTQTVQINYVKPDENGEVILTIAPSKYAQYGYINGLMIHSYLPGDTASGGNPNGILVTNPGKKNENNDPNKLNSLSLQQQTNIITKLTAFPNPFNNRITISAQFEKAQKQVVVRVLDITGRTVVSRNVENVTQGMWQYPLNFDDRSLKPGIYILQILTESKSSPVVFKLIKTQ